MRNKAVWFYVVVAGKLESRWEYRSDALDRAADVRSETGLRATITTSEPAEFHNQASYQTLIDAAA